MTEENGYNAVFAALSKEKELLFLSQKEVVDIHDFLVGKYGGSFGIRDAGALSSAVHRPLQHLAYNNDHDVDAATLGAVLWVGLAKNHAFVDGNKRVALAAALRFWAKNDWILSIEAVDLLNTSLLVARGDLLVNDVASRVKPFLSRSFDAIEKLHPTLKAEELSLPNHAALAEDAMDGEKMIKNRKNASPTV
ncbi:type II toxin-antitoxin system death-on-curing family toxin [Acidithiobacillus thiooxidans]|uniref:type II toxin-antitoxin system death-on-curing family toxin n=1 Tax=Acidithiobacillus thiooxidans TaxID=930 RepID=UPI001C07B392|nr:type II toxin-antitoxin system death-on-curing family toxin [Acidithiobacillus thiooxidans]MBU2792602.1 type II toxin-antitoxin system death-on-curing family toxin [Acidithiobacillus thiooxidans]